MSDEVIATRCRRIIGVAEDAPCTGESLIGVLQRFRPGGEALEGLFAGLPMGAALQSRLRELYVVAGDAARPGGAQDAYFIVRNPPPLAAARAQQCAELWLASLLALARETQFAELAQRLQPLPTVRVLEGLPPKQRKSDLHAFPLYRAIKQQAAELSQRLPVSHEVLDLLRPAYYFAACDWALRDYLLWPVYAGFCQVSDPFAAYFELWRHGAKMRAFSDGQVDVYLPHCA